MGLLECLSYLCAGGEGAGDQVRTETCPPPHMCGQEVLQDVAEGVQRDQACEGAAVGCGESQAGRVC